MSRTIGIVVCAFLLGGVGGGLMTLYVWAPTAVVQTACPETPPRNAAATEPLDTTYTPQGQALTLSGAPKATP